MAMGDMSMPPIPPSVRAQQMPPQADPMMGFASGAGAAINAAPKFSPIEFAIGRLNEVASLLQEVAQVLVVEKPSMMPILQKVAQGGAILMDELVKSTPQGAGNGEQNQEPAQIQMSEPEGTANGLSMS